MSPLPAASTFLQPGAGPVPGDIYLPAEPRNVLWGRLPCSNDAPVLTVDPGATVTIDTISHEGVLEDQGRDPRSFFANHGVTEVLTDAVALAASNIRRDPRKDGPHIVSRPIRVRGSTTGDLLAVTVVGAIPRAPYGVISSRHAKGALPQEYPAGGADHFSAFATVSADGSKGMLPLAESGDHLVTFPLAPFLGIIGVAVAQDTRPSSIPPGSHGGNLDIKLLTQGSTLYLPIQVDGALVYVGDPHYAQGNGEVSLTAMEAPLRTTLRFDVIPRAASLQHFGELLGPIAETTDYLIPIGLDPDLDVAVQNAVRSSIALLQARYSMQPEYAYAYLSAATDFEISQVVDLVKGVHARIRKTDFASAPEQF